MKVRFEIFGDVDLKDVPPPEKWALSEAVIIRDCLEDFLIKKVEEWFWRNPSEDLADGVIRVGIWAEGGEPGVWECDIEPEVYVNDRGFVALVDGEWEER